MADKSHRHPPANEDEFGSFDFGHGAGRGIPTATQQQAERPAHYPVARQVEEDRSERRMTPLLPPLPSREEMLRQYEERHRGPPTPPRQSPTLPRHSPTLSRHPHHPPPPVPRATSSSYSNNRVDASLPPRPSQAGSSSPEFHPKPPPRADSSSIDSKRSHARSLTQDFQARMRRGDYVQGGENYNPPERSDRPPVPVTSQSSFEPSSSSDEEEEEERDGLHHQAARTTKKYWKKGVSVFKK